MEFQQSFLGHIQFFLSIPCVIAPKYHISYFGWEWKFWTTSRGKKSLSNCLLLHIDLLSRPLEGFVWSLLLKWEFFLQMAPYFSSIFGAWYWWNSSVLLIEMKPNQWWIEDNWLAWCYLYFLSRLWCLFRPCNRIWSQNICGLSSLHSIRLLLFQLLHSACKTHFSLWQPFLRWRYRGTSSLFLLLPQWRKVSGC